MIKTLNLINTIVILNIKKEVFFLKKKFVIITFIFIILLSLYYILTYILYDKIRPISEQIKSVNIANTHDYSIMGDSYSNKIYEKYDTVTFGTLSDNKLGLFPKPIEWIVLDKNAKSSLLISKYILDCKAFDYVDIETIDNISDDEKENFKNIDWSTSSLRKWLNNDFLNYSFNTSEKEKILETYLQDVDTSDRIFCLSEDEYKKYFDNDNYYDRIRGMTNHHIYYNGATARSKLAQSYDKYNLFENDETYEYWLRDKTINGEEQGIKFGSTKVVGAYGSIGFVINTNIFIGVRPAMWVSLE